MILIRKFVYLAIKTFLEISCRIDAPDFNEVPTRGPLILYTNHTGAIEVPILSVLLYPRPVTGWGLVESRKKASLHWLFLLWDATPIRGGGRIRGFARNSSGQ